MRECNVETGKVEIVAVPGAIFYGRGMLEFVRTEAACDRHLIGVFSLVQSRNLGLSPSARTFQDLSSLTEKRFQSILAVTSVASDSPSIHLKASNESFDETYCAMSLLWLPSTLDFS